MYIWSDFTIYGIENRKLFFVYGNDDTGKTFLWRILVVKLISEDKTVLTIASFGIVVILLDKG